MELKGSADPGFRSSTDLYADTAGSLIDHLLRAQRLGGLDPPMLRVRVGVIQQVNA